MTDQITLEQQYQEQVIRLAGAHRMKEVVRRDRVKVWEAISELLTNLDDISSAEVRESALALSETPGVGITEAFDQLVEKLRDYRPEAETKGEEALVTHFEHLLARLLKHLAALAKQEVELQREADQHQAEAIRIKQIQTQGPRGIH